MIEARSHQVQPGDKFNFVNGDTVAIRIKVITACGTETISTLHPGADLR